MTHTAALTAAQGLMLYIALLWKLYQLVQAPWDISLRIVTICLACAGAAYPFGIAAGHVALTQMTAGPMLFMWAQEFFLLCLVYTLICFFLFSALDLRRARTQAAWQAVPLVAALAILTAVALAVPRGASPAEYPIAIVSLFYLVADVYVVYGFIVTISWTRRYARQAGRRLARSLLITSLGLTAMTAATALLMATVIIRWSSGIAPSTLVAVNTVLLLLGILLFLAGVTYPGAAMRLAAVPVWLDHLRDYSRMGPLWTELHAAFPQDALSRVPLRPVRDALSFRGVHRRYYRRAIECRDGLVRLSPHLAHLSTTGEHTAIAAQLRHALHLNAACASAPTDAVPVAIPAADGLDADIRELITLARALDTHATHGEP